MKFLKEEDGFIFFQVQSPKEAMVLRFVGQGYGSVTKIGNCVVIKLNDDHLFTKRIATKIWRQTELIMTTLEEAAEQEGE